MCCFLGTWHIAAQVRQNELVRVQNFPPGKQTYCILGAAPLLWLLHTCRKCLPIACCRGCVHLRVQGIFTHSGCFFWQIIWDFCAECMSTFLRTALELLAARERDQLKLNAHPLPSLSAFPLPSSTCTCFCVPSPFAKGKERGRT